MSWIDGSEGLWPMPHALASSRERIHTLIHMNVSKYTMGLGEREKDNEILLKQIGQEAAILAYNQTILMMEPISSLESTPSSSRFLSKIGTPRKIIHPHILLHRQRRGRMRWMRHCHCHCHRHLGSSCLKWVVSDWRKWTWFHLCLASTFLSIENRECLYNPSTFNHDVGHDVRCSLI